MTMNTLFPDVRIPRRGCVGPGGVWSYAAPDHGLRFGPCRVVSRVLEGPEKRAFSSSFNPLAAMPREVRRVFYPLSQAL